ncbi:putative tubulin-specific chaperone Rbl2 [Thozetella sp. PMI_491]|nr:putative tubulin-specific chaperone Rbl2 [Thozetella sp. PMI_491]
MPAPSELKKRTQVVQRLVEEEKSYQKELLDEAAKIKQREEDTSSATENAEFELKQLKLSHAQTQAVLATMPDKIQNAIDVLENQIKISGENAAEDELKKANDILEAAKKAVEKEE